MVGAVRTWGWGGLSLKLFIFSQQDLPGLAVHRRAGRRGRRRKGEEAAVREG